MDYIVKLGKRHIAALRPKWESSKGVCANIKVKEKGTEKLYFWKAILTH